MPRACRPRQIQGFTLVECLAVVAIVALLAVVGAPGWQQQRAEASLRAGTRQAVAALHMARQMALGTGKPVTACPSPDGWQCVAGARQWIVFRQERGGSAGRRLAADTLVDTWQMPARLVVTATRDYASFLPQTSAASTATFRFCHPDAPQRHRAVVVSQTGRVRLTRPPRPASTAGQAGCPR